MKSDHKILIDELLDLQSVWIELTDQESKKQMGGVQESKSNLSPSLVQVLTTAEIQLSQKWVATRFGDIALFISITSAYSH
ncbi:hypothetical protein [Nodularia sp. UHCC 0506]|uniref:hypothetical protein n=1 Tax=Nodularia sp. UHCC 0506 TaxID=3110243 RepID=UPI002B201140|nr:hypothetical protein [Nodularia sp. UHCC 0506]MEA5512493.1 hypothetical protein [Nodularia sp. UHCC 0506]